MSSVQGQSFVSPDAPTTKPTRYLALASAIRPYSHSPGPIWSIAGLFLASSVLPHTPSRPPLLYRFGFGVIFAGAGYVLSAGDTRNGTGITTAWSLTYLFLNLRKSFKPPRSALSLMFSAATLASSALYGTEYFLLQDSEPEP